MITKYQIAAARALLEWTQDDLANASGVSKDMISKIESGKSAGSLKSIQSIEDGLLVAGIEFGENDSVKRSTAQIRVLKGQKGFLDFYDEVFEEIQRTGATSVSVSNVDERKFVQWQGDQLEEHSARMNALGTNYKILIQNGDNYFPASDYAEYRWMPKGTFYSVPFYIFGKKVAMFIFDENEPRIYILREPELTKVYKAQFESLWEQSTKPEVDNA
jgi:transcriptional regulator with XRE-family HTH domain